MIKRVLFSVLTILVAGVGSNLQAQFEGHVEMKTYSDDKEGNIHASYLDLYATKERIMIKGKEKLNLNEDFGAEGLLIRNDLKDFVLLTGEEEALQVTKQGIESLVEWFAGWDEETESSPEPDVVQPNYEFTERTRTILGYECTEMIIRDDENEGSYLSVWLTPSIDINWGVLAEPWRNLPKDIEKEVNGMPQEVFFKGRNYPMMVEVYDSGERKTLMEVTKVERSNIAKAMVQVPSGVTLISAQEYIIGAMMN